MEALILILCFTASAIISGLLPGGQTLKYIYGVVLFCFAMISYQKLWSLWKLRCPNKNLKKLRKFMLDIVDETERLIDDGKPSCKKYILEEYSNIAKELRADSEVWEDDFDYTSVSYKLLYYISFNLLTSGRIHVYRGILDESKGASHMKKICEVCLDWCEENELISEDERQEQLGTLYKKISLVG